MIYCLKNRLIEVWSIFQSDGQHVIESCSPMHKHTLLFIPLSSLSSPFVCKSPIIEIRMLHEWYHETKYTFQSIQRGVREEEKWHFVEHIFTCMGWVQTGFGLVIGFIGQFNTTRDYFSQFSSAAVFISLLITASNGGRFSSLWISELSPVRQLQ
jgi:hypothetical protein